MLKVSARSFLTLVAVAALMAAPVANALDVDLYTTVTASTDTAAPGDIVDYTMTLGNNGPDAGPSMIGLVNLPAGYPDMYFPEDQVDAVWDAFATSVGGTFHMDDESVSGIYYDFDCTGYMVLVYGQEQEAGFLDPGTEATVNYSIEMPELPVQHQVFSVEGYNDTMIYDPAGGHYQNGIDCADEATWFGPRLIDVPAVTAPIELVYDEARTEQEHASGGDHSCSCGGAAVERVHARAKQAGADDGGEEIGAELATAGCGTRRRGSDCGHGYPPVGHPVHPPLHRARRAVG